jgi:predicted site-specific integrase-resolvase
VLPHNTPRFSSVPADPRGGCRPPRARLVLQIHKVLRSGGLALLIALFTEVVRPRQLTKGAAVSSTNGHGPKRAILYARVSGEEQVKKGYSLADQLDALRDWCSTNDYEIIDEVQDRGFSGAYLERPGLDRIREMVAGGEVDAVVVLFRDRIARGVYAQRLSEEFRESGARLVALNSRGDDSPDGELGDNILDVIAAWERKKIFALGHLHPPFREQSDSALLR